MVLASMLRGLTRLHCLHWRHSLRRFPLTSCLQVDTQGRVVGFDSTLIVECCSRCSCLRCGANFTLGNITGRPGFECSSCFWMPYFYVNLVHLIGCDLISGWVMSFHDVLRVWTHGTTLEIGSLAVHVGLHEVYRLSCGHMSFDLEMWVSCLSCEINMNVWTCHEDSWQDC